MNSRMKDGYFLSINPFMIECCLEISKRMQGFLAI